MIWGRRNEKARFVPSLLGCPQERCSGLDLTGLQILRASEMPLRAF